MDLPWPNRCEKDGTFDAETYLHDVDRGLEGLFDLTDPRRFGIDAAEQAVQKFVADWSGPTFEQAIFVGGCVRIQPPLLESQGIDRSRAEELAAACGILLAIVERGINPRRVENLRGALADYLGLSMVQADKPSGGDDAFRELAEWAANKLRGNQRLAVEMAVENNGRIRIADFASEVVVGWEPPYDDSVSSLIRELKRKLRFIGWQARRHDNEILIERLTSPK